jgi:hypothetical protein
VLRRTSPAVVVRSVRGLTSGVRGDLLSLACAVAAGALALSAVVPRMEVPSQPSSAAGPATRGVLPASAYTRARVTRANPTPIASALRGAPDTQAMIYYLLSPAQPLPPVVAASDAAANFVLVLSSPGDERDARESIAMADRQRSALGLPAVIVFDLRER